MSTVKKLGLGIVLIIQGAAAGDPLSTVMRQPDEWDFLSAYTEGETKTAPAAPAEDAHLPPPPKPAPELTIRQLLLSERDRHMSAEQRAEREYIELCKKMILERPAPHLLAVLLADPEVGAYMVMGIAEALQKTEEVREGALWVSGDLVKNYSKRTQDILETVKDALALTPEDALTSEVADALVKLATALVNKVGAESKVTYSWRVPVGLAAAQEVHGKLLASTLSVLDFILIQYPDQEKIPELLAHVRALPYVQIKTEDLEMAVRRLKVSERSALKVEEIYRDLKFFGASREVEQKIFSARLRR